MKVNYIKMVEIWVIMKVNAVNYLIELISVYRV